MKYVILSDSDNVEPFIEPRQLAKINGEPLVARTIRLLKENGVKEVLITSHDKRFDNLGAIRYEPLNNNYNGKKQTGYWLDAFPRELITQPITFLLGDVYFSENAIKTIVNSNTESILFFCTDRKLGYSDKYIKHHDEPFGFKVVDCKKFLEHIDIVKTMYDEHKTRRHPISWELYRSINGIDVNTHELTTNYIAINDETCDIDRIDDIMLIESKLGGKCMVKCEAIKDFTLRDFDKLHNIVRKNLDQEGKIFAKDVFECDETMATYLSGANAKKQVVIKVLEVIPEVEDLKLDEIPVEEPKPKKKTTKKSKKK